MRVSNVVITYSITHAMVQKLSGVLNYVDYYMVNILHKYQHKQYQMPYDYTLRSLRDTTDYITSVNSQLNNIAIAYLSWRISIEE